MRFIKFCQLATLASALACSASSWALTPLQQKMSDQAEQIVEFYSANYAPADWKKQLFKWDLATESAKLQAAIAANPPPNLHQYHQHLRTFIQSMRDYHVSIRFMWTEKATLPLLIRSAQGRYYVVYIDRQKLSESSFPFAVGDEITEFDGRPIAEVVGELIAQMGGNSPATDRALAELSLTSRAAARGLKVPRGGVVLRGRSQATGLRLESQPFWNYVPERVNPEVNLRDLGSPATTPLVRKFSGGGSQAKASDVFEREMALPFADDPAMVPRFGSPYDIGGRQSHLPPLGAIIRQPDEKAQFHSYIYRTTQGRLVGVVRIPSYMAADFDRAVAEFRDLMIEMNGSTDALVIDQLNNPGGALFYGSALISYLADSDVASPREQIKLTQAEILEADALLNQAGNVQSDEDARKQLGPSLVGYPVSLQTALSAVEWARQILQDWSDGLTLSRAHYFITDRIAKAPRGSYAKPILFLTNELDFSCGDFVPAILQDHNRGRSQRHVTIFGTQTAGAGGYILSQSLLNQLGVSSLSVTGSIAERAQPQKNPIENLGVTPDIPYEVTARDLQMNYVDYVQAVNNAIEEILK